MSANLQEQASVFGPLSDFYLALWEHLDAFSDESRWLHASEVPPPEKRESILEQKFKAIKKVILKHAKATDPSYEDVRSVYLKTLQLSQDFMKNKGGDAQLREQVDHLKTNLRDRGLELAKLRVQVNAAVSISGKVKVTLVKGPQFEEAPKDPRAVILDDFLLNVEAELAADYMGQAEALFNEGQSGKFEHVPAAVLTGAVLESALRKLCDDHQPPIPTADANGIPKTLKQLIDDLRKANVFNEVKAKQLHAWTDIRNKAAHGEFDQFKRTDVEQMIEGVKVFLADYWADRRLWAKR